MFYIRSAMVCCNCLDYLLLREAEIEGLSLCKERGCSLITAANLSVIRRRNRLAALLILRRSHFRA
jgi:hypothetical protein